MNDSGPTSPPLSKEKSDAENSLAQLRTALLHYENLVIAVSGGVDSMTLATVAHSTLPAVVMVHAVSPAVPGEATARVHHYASRFGWQLQVIDAGEFADTLYRANPVNRCYYCKSNLYTMIKNHTTGIVASGANLDDLGDYRPGLIAARENGVVHPLIDSNINKACVRSIARLLELDQVADLPAQPCLSSRVETGLAIDPDDLMFVHKVEKYLSKALGAGDIRCRISHAGVRIEIAESLIEKNASNWALVKTRVEALVIENNRTLAGYSTYVRGSAFIH
jgi:uncharacterized protein